MTIFLFGVSNVGKTTTGELLSRKLEYDFYDLDEEVKKFYNTTLEDFVNTGSIEERDWKRGRVIDMTMKKKGNKVFSITPIAYPDHFNRYLACEDVLAIELQDSSEHIFDRLVFSDENDHVYKDDDYKNRHRDHYLEEIRKDLNWYGAVYSDIKNIFDVSGMTPEEAAAEMMDQFHLCDDRGDDRCI